MNRGLLGWPQGKTGATQFGLPLGLAAPTLEFAQSSTAATSAGITVTAAGSTHTKGSWTELVAATPFDVRFLVIYGAESDTGGINAYFFYDIGVGSAGSEQVIIPNLPKGHFGSYRAPEAQHVPMFIPAGTRIAARCQCTTASRQIAMAVTMFNAPLLPVYHGMEVEAWGVTLSTTRGTVIDAGVSANTKGSWVELTERTGIKTRAVLFQSVADTNVARTDGHHRVDLGMGIVGQEEVLIADMHMRQDGAIDRFMFPQYGPLPIHIPAGVRLVVRHQSTVTDATDRLIDVVAHGIS